MSDRELKFRKLLKDNGVTKCYIGGGFSFDDQYPNGTILVDHIDNKFGIEIYKLFTEDKDGLLGDEQSLFIAQSDFIGIDANYSLGV